MSANSFYDGKVPVPVPAGSLLTVTTGCYSDYTIDGVFRALVEVDMSTLLEEWFKKHPDQLEPYKFDDRGFIASISHMVETVDCYEVHLSNYSCIGEAYVTKMTNDSM